MSIENIVKFREVINNDESLRKEFQTALEKSSEATKEGEASDFSPVIELAEKRGFTFTRSELSDYLEDIELSEEELEMVAGGPLIDYGDMEDGK